MKKLLIVLMIMAFFVPILWFDGLTWALLAWEEFYSIAPQKWWDMFFTAWHSQYNLWHPSLLLSYMFPQWLFFMILEKLWVSMLLSQKLWFVSLWALAWVGMFLLMNYLLRDSKYRIELSCIVAIFYLINPHIISFSVLLTPIRFLMIALPFIFYFLLKAKDCHYNFKYSMYIWLITFLIWSIYVNPPIASIMFILIILFCFIDFLFSNQKKKVLIFLMITTLFIFLLNCWWILPFIYNLDLWFAKEVTGDYNVISTLWKTELFETLRLMWQWAFRDAYDGKLYFPYNNEYYNSILTLITFIIPILVIWWLLVFMKRDKITQILLVLVVLFLFLSKWVSDPFGSVYSFLFNHLPWFWMYREPYAKFMPMEMFLMSLWLGIVLNHLFNSMNQTYRKMIIIFVIVSIGLSAYPLFWKFVIHWDDYGNRSENVLIPEYWKQASQSLVYKDLNNSLLYPPAQFSWPYMWDHGFSWNPTILFKNKNFINYYSAYEFTRASRLIDNVFENLHKIKDFESIKKVMALLNIRSVLQLWDIDVVSLYRQTWTFWHEKFQWLLVSEDDDNVKNLLMKNFNHQIQIWKLNYYNTQDKYYLPIIYVPKDVIVTKWELNTIYDIVSQKNYNINSAIYFDTK